MTVYFILPAETIYDAQKRVMGWKHTPCSRDNLKKLRTIAPRLKELGAERVVCSDLDGQSGWFLARELKVPCEEWHTLRRLNYGKLHGAKSEKADKELSTIRERWAKNPDIPLHSGDSLKSFEKRMACAKDRLAKNGKVSVVLAAPFEIASITGKKGNYERERIYLWAE